jgi:fused signal recognition particle receptor
MTFNWFNRNNNPPAESAAPGPDPAAPIESAPETSEAPDSEAMLNYAKQAYENLKQQKAASAATPEAEVPAPLPQAPETPEVKTTVPTKLYVAPADDSALPFWARAEADRDVRLARLRETAVQAPESLVVAPADSPTVATTADFEALKLDGDFLWSMEVLAMEGRRPEDITIEEITWLKQLRQGLDRTRRSLINSLRSIVGQGPLNEAGVLEIEALLLQADVGVQATDRIIAALQAKLKEEVLPPEAAIAYLKQILRELLEEPLQGKHRVAFVPEKDQLNIWLITGVNGAGKTTTIGKLAHIASKSGYKCLIAAADTFRAAAVEQVKVWGDRSDVEVIANAGKNTDPAAVVFDGILAAQSRGSDLLLVDTAGRLQNKKNLMDELSKIRRIIDKNAAGARVESLLVLDATLGQNGLQQAKIFAEAAQLSGVVLTKLDGTAKGGIALAVVQQLGLPIRFIGAGEGIEDLRPFSSYEFVEALVSG